MTRDRSRPVRRRSLLAGVAGLAALAGCTIGGGGSGSEGDGGNDGDSGGDGDSSPTDTDTGDGGSGGATDGDGATDTDEATGTDSGGGSGDGADGGTRTASGELDLREANVTGVTVGSRDGGTVRFDVTLYHDDDGEDGYANWWQVETRDGERLGRRELLHAHGTREFTRSAEIEVPDGVDCVVVRGHDETHGYGGQAALVRVSTGEVRLVGQASERAALSGPCPGSG